MSVCMFHLQNCRTDFSAIWYCGAYTKNCQENVISLHVGSIQPLLCKFNLKNVMKNRTSCKKVVPVIEYRSHYNIKVLFLNFLL
jgi:hypothetical protein